MDFTPTILQQVKLPRGRLELIEWQWPDMIDFLRTETELMIEMSLPPFATNASAEFPGITQGEHCFMGTVFIRYPGVAVHGRGEGGQIRVIRLTFSANTANLILRSANAPSLQLLQSLLDIRSAVLRTLMRLALRELTHGADRSLAAMNAILELLAIEVRRILAQPALVASRGRLAGWQYRRIRERLMSEGAMPTVAELAELCGISPRHLHRQFLALTGMTVAKYVESVQIERAKEMLIRSISPIQHIAFACGFSHPNSFARAFRRATAMSPLVFRQTSVAAGQETPEFG